MTLFWRKFFENCLPTLSTAIFRSNFWRGHVHMLLCKNASRHLHSTNARWHSNPRENWFHRNLVNIFQSIFFSFHWLLNEWIRHCQRFWSTWNTFFSSPWVESAIVFRDRAFPEQWSPKFHYHFFRTNDHTCLWRICDPKTTGLHLPLCKYLIPGGVTILLTLTKN